jgi:hypothetical protein
MSTERDEVLANQGKEDSPQEKKASLFERLIPILFVDDLQARTPNGYHLMLEGPGE